MKKMNKLELTWIGKEKQIKVEPRLLIEDKEKSYGDDNTENMLIHGDNLLALKALEDKYTNSIKCIYIDPPYNTGYAFESYEDGLEHSIWLSLMRDRLVILKKLLRDDGFIFIQIDDNEQSYLKVLCDEIFGRNNFITQFIWIGRAGKGGTNSNIASQHEYIICYSKSNEALLKKEKRISNNGNYSDERGSYKREQLRQWGQADRRLDRPTMWYPILSPEGTEIYPIKDDGSEGRWRVKQETCSELIQNNDLDFVKTNDSWKVYRKIRDGKTTESSYGSILDNYGTSATGTAQLKELFGYKIFDTPKPEELICHLIYLSSNEGDYVLDSFLGSGTTCAVAHKMSRKWIGIEMGTQAYDVCVPRINKVINGEQGGISKLVKWQGGGGYKFYELAPSLLVKDKFDNWIISENYNGILLVKAICKQEKFDYIEKSEIYWKQGKSSENDYIFVTTNHISIEYLNAIHEEMQENESLLICCKTYQEECEERYDNITIKKIPQTILNNCEYGKDDYSLNVDEVLEIDEDE